MKYSEIGYYIVIYVTLLDIGNISDKVMQNSMYCFFTLVLVPADRMRCRSKAYLLDVFHH
jgi:hypothetical protein